MQHALHLLSGGTLKSHGQLNSNNPTYVVKAVDNAKFLIEETVIGLTPYISAYLVRHQTTDALEFKKKKLNYEEKNV